MSQEQGLHATCETKVLYCLPAELRVQSIQGVVQLLTESIGSFNYMQVMRKRCTTESQLQVTGGARDINSVILN